jgi:hypothetical protein
MKSQNPSTNAQNMRTEIRSDEPEGTGENGPSLAEIRQRAFEIHIERGGIHRCVTPSSTRRTAESYKFARNNLEKELLTYARNGFRPLR